MALLTWTAADFPASAAAQQVALLAAVYQDDQDGARRILAAEGSIALWRHDNDTWPPSYAVFKGTGPAWFVVIAGTVNASQIVLQGGATNYQTAIGTNGAQAGFIWQLAWQQIAPDIASVVPIDSPATQVYLSGHSYGGSVAAIGARALAERMSPDRVFLLTLGMPRTFGAEDPAPAPAASWRIFSTGDAVSNLVYGGVGMDVIAPPNPWSVLVANLAWQHKGTGFQLTADGMIPEGQVNTMNLPPLVTLSTLGQHGLKNYTGRLRAYIQNHGNDATGLFATVVAESILTGQAVQTLTNRVSLDGYGIPDPVLSDLLWYDLSRPGRPIAGASGMPSVYKVVYRFRSPQGFDWTELYYVQASSADDALVIGQGNQNVRLSLLDTSNTWIEMRSINTTASRDSSIKPIGLQGTMATGTNDTPEVVGVTALLTIVSQNSVKRKLSLRGMSDGSVLLKPNGQPNVGPQLQSNIGSWINALENLGYGTISRTPPSAGGAYAWHDVTKVDGTVTPGYATITTAINHGLVANDQAIISSMNKKSLPGMNGTYKVLTTTDTTFVIKYTVPGNLAVTQPGGRSRKLTLGNFSVVNSLKKLPVAFSVRKTKNPFTRSRGASVARRPKRSA